MTMLERMYQDIEELEWLLNQVIQDKALYSSEDKWKRQTGALERTIMFLKLCHQIPVVQKEPS